MTSPPEQGLLDTSVFVARESGRALNVRGLPDVAAVSVVTLGELHAGVLAAGDTETRARRLATLESASDIEVIDIDQPAAAMWARLRVHLAEQGRRVPVNDLWIAAIAAARSLPIVTQDDDFAPLEKVAGLTIVRV